MNGSVNRFLKDAERSGSIYLEVPVIGVTQHSVRHVSEEMETILIETQPDLQDRFRVETVIKASSHPDGGECDAKLIHDRSMRNLSRFHVKEPDYRPTRADFRVEAPPGVEAQVQVTRRSNENLADQPWEPVDIVDISVGGIGFQFDEEHDLQYGDIIDIHLRFSMNESFLIEGSIVYIEYREDFDTYQAGVTFTYLSKEDRQELFNFLNKIKLDQSQTAT